MQFLLPDLYPDSATQMKADPDPQPLRDVSHLSSFSFPHRRCSRDSCSSSSSWDHPLPHPRPNDDIKQHR